MKDTSFQPSDDGRIMVPNDPRGVLLGGMGLPAPAQGSAAVYDAVGLSTLETRPGTQDLRGNNTFLRRHLSASFPLNR